MKRDPMAIAWSNYRTWFPARGMAYSNRMEDIGAFMQAYEALLDFFQERFPDQIYTCDYEALTEDPAGETRTMITWLGLNHEDGLVDISTNTRAVRTASVAQVRDQIAGGYGQTFSGFRQSHRRDGYGAGHWLFPAFP